MKETTTKDLRSFGIVLGCILGLFGTIHFLKGHPRAYFWFYGFGAVSLITGIFVPRVLGPVFRVFTKVAHAIGWFNTRVILILVYYLLLTPISFLKRLFGEDALNRRIDRGIRSYWIKRENVSAVRESLERQF